MMFDAAHPVESAPFLSPETILADIRAMLPDAEAIGADDNLVELGLDSMQVMRLVNGWRRAGADVNFAMLMEHPTLRAWQDFARTRRSDAALEMTPPSAAPGGPFPLTDAQHAYWIGRRADQPLGGVACHAYLEIDGCGVEASRLEAAWRALQGRHPMLRARFLESGEQEIMAEAADPHVVVHDFRALSEAERETALAAVRERLSHRKPQVERGEVMGLELSLLPEGGTRLHFDLDLLVADVQSLRLILRDLARAYRGEPLAARPDWSFAAYLERKRVLREQELAADRDWWRERLADLPGAPGLPLAATPETVGVPRFVRRRQRLGRAAWERLQLLAARHRLTPAMTLLSAYAQVLARWSAAPRFLVNIPLFDRQPQGAGFAEADLADVVADFTNLLLLPVDCGEVRSFVEQARIIQADFHRTARHSLYSGVAVQRDLARQAGAEGRSGGAAAPVVFASNLGAPLLSPECRETFGRLHDMISQTPQVWLDFQIYEDEDGLLLAWDAVEALFPDGVLDQMFAALNRLLCFLAADADNWRLPCAAADTPDAAPARWREALAVPPPTPADCLHTAFFAQAAAAPERAALFDPEEGAVSYGDLARRALAVAALLRDCGVEPGAAVAVSLPRGSRQVTAVLGVLAAGAVYVPVGIDQPDRRRSAIHKQAGIRGVLSGAEERSRHVWPEGCPVWDTAEAETHPPLAGPVPVSPEASAYIIFTSGSTGVPKGVEMSHAAAWNTIADINRRFQVGPDDRLLAVSALDFDLSVYDIFGVLGRGGALVLLDEARRRDAGHWLRLIREHRVSLWNSAPILLDMLLAAAESDNATSALASLRQALLSGDWIALDLPERLDRAAPACRLAALGGATEAAIWSNVFEVTLPLDPTWKSIPYGRPLARQAYRVMDAQGRDCPDRVTGELWIGGAGLARGYRGAPDLTAERFVERDGERWYRTGDLGRFWPDGTIEFLGRQDFQVKIRGHRIETGEIEAVLRQHPGIAEAVVTASGAPGKTRQLAAFVVPAAGENALFADESRDAALAERLSATIERVGETQAARLPGAGTVETYTRFWQGMEAVAIPAIRKSLGELDLFTRPDERHSLDDLLTRGRIRPGFRRLLEQWLTALAEAGLLVREGELWTNPAPLPPAEEALAAQWRAIEEAAGRDPHAAILFAYFKSCCDRHVDLLRGEVNPLSLFFPDGSWTITEALYQLNPLAHYYNRIVAEVAAAAANGLPEDQPLRALEVGAGTGGTAASVLPLLPPERTSYIHTDITGFFESGAREKFGNYPFIRFRRFDIDRDPLLQGYAPHGFDLILAANVLHDAENLPKTLKAVARLLAPGGHLVILEGTRNIRLQMLSIGFIEGLSHFADERIKDNLPLLAADRWQELLAGAGLAPRHVFPKNNALGDAFFEQHVLVARAPLSARLFRPERVRDFLAERLPNFMIPTRLHLLDALPLSANGKLDRKALPEPVDMAEEGKNAPGAGAQPQGRMETALAAVWQAVLERPCGRHDNFFELGGDSLLAIRIVGKIKNDLGLNLGLEHVFGKPTIAELAAVLEAEAAHAKETERDGSSETPLPVLIPDAAKRYAPFPLTEVQQAYLLGRSGDYALGQVAAHCYFELDAERLDLARAEAAWRRLIDQHDMLRAVMLPDGTQRILEQTPPWRIQARDLRHLEREAVGEALEATRAELSHRAPDPGRWPLFDLHASLLPDDRTRLHIGFDNLILDGWSMFHLLAEWKRLYDDPQAPLPELEISFRDYVLARETLLRSDRAAVDRDYWLARLPELPPAPELPLAANADRPGEAGGHRFTRLETRLDAVTWRNLRREAKRLGLSPSAALLAVYAEVLAAWSKEPRFTLNLTQFDRLPLHPQVGTLVGDFTSLTLLEVDNGRGGTFAERARDLQGQLWRDMDHPLMGGVAIQRELARRRREYGGAIMPIVFTSALGVEDLGETTRSDRWLGRLAYNISQTPQVWLDHQAYEQAGEVVLVWDAVAGLFPEGLLEAMFAAYEGLLRQLAEGETGWRTSRFALLPEDQRERREAANAVDVAVSSELLHSLFLEQARQRPEADALIFPGGRMSYRELERRARRVALALSGRDAGANRLVAVAMDKGWEQAVAALGILMTGAAWLPLDPAQPMERLGRILEEAGVETILTQSRLLGLDWPAATRRIAVDTLGETDEALPALRQGPEDLAYVIYTSGSTGQPKGVMIDHRGAVNTILDINRRFGVGPDDRVLALANLGFDLSVYDIFGLLAAGGGVVFPERDAVKEPARWAELIREHRVSVWNTAPAMMGMLAEHSGGQAGVFPSLRLTLLSGDWIPVDLPAKVRTMTDGGAVIALGGATEASIWSNWHPATSIPPGCASVPYGRPLANQRLYVLDAAMRPRPDWVTGQLYIGGLGLAQGYLHDVGKTAAAFVRHPATGERLYRTGDLGRYLPDGCIEFLGREDNQVKINGYRVELGEVEAAMQSHPGVREAVALVTPEGQLAAFVSLEADGHALFRTLPCDVEQARARWAGAAALAAQALRECAADLDRAALARQQAAIERLALETMALILGDLGLFGGVEADAAPVSADEAARRAGIAPRYREMFRRWLALLTQAGMLAEQDGRFARGAAWPSALSASGAENRAVRDWLERMRPFGAAMFQEQRQASEVFFARENDLAPESLAQVLPGAALTDGPAAAALAGFIGKPANNAGESAGPRILLLGVQSATAARAWLERTAGCPRPVFAEQSRFFVGRLQENAGDLDLDARLFDPDREAALQGWEAHGFDLIVADQFAHRARNLHQALRRIRSLLKPGGLLLLREGTGESALAQLNAAFLEDGFSGYADERAETRQPFIGAEAWTAALLEAGFAEASQGCGDLAPLLGQSLFLARAPETARVFAPEELKAYLATKLPDYMRPADITALAALPLTANGKIDRKALAACQAACRAPRRGESAGDETALATETERELAAIWREVLQVERVDALDNFFELGGDSLLATRLAARARERFGAELPLRALFAHPCIRELAACLETGPATDKRAAEQASGLPRIQPDPANENRPFPLTAVQHAYVAGRSGLYPLGNVAAHCYFEYDTRDLDLPRAEAAWQRLVAQHGMLRAVFPENGARQQILASVPPYRIVCSDLNGLAPAEAAERLDEVRAAMSHQVLPIDRWPLFDLRVSLYGGDRARIHISLDNLIVDGWSMFHVLTGWSRLYSEPDLPLPAPRLSFRDYVLGEAEIRAGDRYRRDRDYWLGRMADLPPAPVPPLARAPLAGDRYGFRRRQGEVAAERWTAVKDRAQALGVSASGILLAAYAEVLAAWSGRDRFTINLTMFNRLPVHEGIGEIAGDFTSLSLLAVDMGSGRNFAERARNLQEQLWEDLDHPCFSGVELLREMGAAANQDGEDGGMPIVFTSALGLNQSDENAITRSSLGEFVYGISQTPQVLLDHQAFEAGGKLLLVWDAAEDYFPAGLLDDMFAAYLRLMNELADHADPWEQERVVRLPGEQAARHRALNDTERIFDGPDLLHELFLEQAARHPENPALLAGDTRISYRELAGRAGALARELLAAGAAPDKPVAIVMDKGWEQAVAALGILMSGAAWLPLSGDTPPERLAHILREADVRLVCIQERLRHAHNWPDGIRLFAVDAMNADPTATCPKSVQRPDNLAYVIYTSGSTGKPKGVMIDHHGAVNTIKDLNSRFGVGPDDRIFAISALNFDLSVYDIFGALAAGAAVVFPDPSGLKDPAHWCERIRRHGVTVWNSAPALMRMLASYLEARPQARPESLRLALLSGDWIAPDLPAALRRLCPGMRLISLGGATEASIWSICHPIPEDHPADRAVPYGRPLANQRFYVLDRNLDECPDWVRGGLYIAGEGLAKGYWQDAEKTAAAFFSRPASGERLYATGDRGRYLPDGTIEFLGRDDGQVKIRGHRIELGEIESVLKSLPEIADAVALKMTGDQDNPFLAAWLVCRTGAQTDATAVREALRAHLPGYMVPERLVFLPEMPLTANGKVDRRALTLPDAPEEAAPSAPAEPATAEEEAVSAIWAQVLKRPHIDRHANFFEAGGDSLTAVELTNAFFKAFQVEIPLTELFRDPTVAGMAALLSGAAGTSPAPGAEGESGPVDAALPQVRPDPAARFEPFPLTDVQQAYWLGRSPVYELGNVATHTYFEIESEMDVVRLERAWNLVLARHDMLRAVLLPDGGQRVLETVPEYRFAVRDLREMGEAEREAALLATRREMEHLMHPVDQWPLFEIRADRIDDRLIRLQLSFDALILDGWSMGVIFRDWTRFYHDPAAQPPRLDLSYRDYVLADAAIRDTPRFRRDQNFHLERLAGLPPAPPLPLAKSFAQIERPHFVRFSHRFAKTELAALRALAARENLTLAAVLLAAYGEVLARWSGAGTFTVNVSFFNRLPLHQQVMDIVGDFTSVQLLPLDCARPRPFLEAARAVQDELWQGLEHRCFSGVRLLRELARLRGTPQAAIMPVVFTSFLGMEQNDQDDNQAITLLGRMIHNVSQTPQVALDNQAGIFAGELGVNWDVVPELFPEGLIADMFQAYCDLLTGLAQADADWRRPFAPDLPAAQRARRNKVNATQGPVSAKLLHELFLEQAQARPDALAVADPRRRLSYGELAVRAGALAVGLVERGIRPGELVAVVMDKGWEQAAAVLGILMAGAAYLPIAADVPPERLAFILKDAGARAALTQPRLVERLTWPDGVAALAVPEEMPPAGLPAPALPPQAPDNLAYVIYTSGSTGKPKGVMIDHRGAVNTILDINSRFGVGPEDRIFGLSQLHFDLSVYDIFGALAAGAALILPHPDHGRNPAHWLELARREGLTVWNSVPALMQMLVVYGRGRADARMPGLRLALLSGDWFPVDLPAGIRELAPACRIVSLGGATEASIWSNAWEVTGDTGGLPSIPYGFPLRNQEFHVLDAAMRDCPDWTAGELYIGGIGLARGYWRDEEKTAAAFVAHPRSGKRLYRTGDLGRYLPDGALEFLGRKDFQLKINGFRIEPGEIEAACKAHPQVADALVMGLDSGRGKEKRLVAWLVPERGGNPSDVEALTAFLRESLPDYMIPADMVFLDAFPLSDNGKVDRRALPLPTVKSATEAEGRAARPLTATETQVAAVVAEVLGLETAEVELERQFFDLGANSLDIVRMQNRLDSLRGGGVSVVDFFSHPTVEKLSRHLDGAGDGAPAFPTVGAERPKRRVLSRRQARRR